jgi:hypothetical protein
MGMTFRTLRTAGGLGDGRRSTQRQAEVPVTTRVPVAVDSRSVPMEQRIDRRRTHPLLPPSQTQNSLPSGS